MRKIIVSTILLIILIIIAAYSFRNYRIISNAESFYNLGNQSYKLSQEDGKNNESFLQESLEYYEKSLEIRENEDTRYNYEFVKEILKNNKKKKETKNNKDENTKDTNESGKNEEQNQDKNNSKNDQEKNEGKSQSREDTPKTQEGGKQGQEEDSGKQGNQSNVPQQNGVTSKRGEEYKLQQQQDISELSEQDLKELEELTQQIKKEQVYNQKYFGKKQQKSEFNSLFDSFFGRVDRGGEKDW